MREDCTNIVSFKTGLWTGNRRHRKSEEFNIERGSESYAQKVSIPYHMNGLVESDSLTSKLDFNTVPEGGKQKKQRDQGKRTGRGEREQRLRDGGRISHLVSVKDTLMQWGKKK